MFESDMIKEVISVAYVMAIVFVFIIGLFVLFIAVLAVIDLTQRKNAVRHNFPVLGRLRDFFTFMGTFFRQYFFALDHEELPFNRAQRNWAYRASKDEDSTLAFGSVQPMTTTGNVLFVNCPFPTLEEDTIEASAVTIGPYCATPYSTASIFNISGMSYGAISKPAVLALSKGAKMAGIWMNTGEGGLSPYHLEGGADIVMQIGTVKYGVRRPEGGLSDEKLKAAAAHEEVKMFELKLSQGAKPGKDGILPGEKVTEEIAAIRGIEPGQDSISPNRHPEINSVSDLLDMIAHIREVTGKSPSGLKP
jgi:glutamate synthase domain-containing protein 2